MSSSAAPIAPWRVVSAYELRSLWLSAKGLTVLLGYALLLSVLSYVAATDAALNLLDARESVGILVKIAIGVGALAALVVSADAISGERERATLEALLVTPVPRRALVLGKLVGASSMWLAAIVVALPYVVTMARGPGVVLDAVVVLLGVGALVGAALTAFGLAVSAVSLSNRVSLATSVGTLLVLAAPGQLPAVASRGPLSTWLVVLNPVGAGLKLVGRVLIDQAPLRSEWPLLIAPVAAVVVLTWLATCLSTRVRLGGAR